MFVSFELVVEDWWMVVVVCYWSDYYCVGVFDDVY